MSKTLHAAIRRALADSPAYAQRGILVSALLDARTDLNVEGELLYNSVYTLFSVLPSRLVPGTTFLVATMDVPGGVELSWEGREESAAGDGHLREVLRQGPHGDLAGIAYAALERFCGLRAGECVSERTRVPASPQFPRGEATKRRVRAFLPASLEEGLASIDEWRGTLERKADIDATEVAPS